MKKIIYLLISLVLSISCKKENQKFKKTTEVIYELEQKTPPPIIKLPIDYTFSTKEKVINGDLFFKERAKLNEELDVKFLFSKKSKLINAKEYLYKRYGQKSEYYFSDYNFSDSYNIENNLNFNLSLMTSNYGDIILVSSQKNKIIDVLNLHTNYISFEGQESLYRNFLITNDMISIYDYVFYEPIGEVLDENETNDSTQENPSSDLIINFYEIKDNGLFIKVKKELKNTILSIGKIIHPKVETYLNVRNSPETDSKIITKAYPKDELIILEILEGWLKISFNGTKGYVSSDYVK